MPPSSGSGITARTTEEASPRADGSLPARGASPGAVGGRLTPEHVFVHHFDFVWRSLGRLGVPPEGIEDAAQDVFLVVHRRLADFEGRSSLTTWLYGIALRVARDHRRRQRRIGTGDPDHLHGRALRLVDRHLHHRR